MNNFVKDVFSKLLVFKVKNTFEANMFLNEIHPFQVHLAF
jgi:hypothetical protein